MVPHSDSDILMAFRTTKLSYRLIFPNILTNIISKFIRPFLIRHLPHLGNVRQDLVQRYRQSTEDAYLVEKKIIKSVGCKRLYVFCHFFYSRQVFLLGVATIGQHTEMDGEVVVEAFGFNQDGLVGFV